MSNTGNGTKKELPDKRTYTVEEFARILGIGRTSAYAEYKHKNYFEKAQDGIQYPQDMDS